MSKVCGVQGCTRKYLAKGFCAFHYKRNLFGRDLCKEYRPEAILPKDHPVYVSWTNMKTRCDNPNSTQYKWYGARGIGYCVRWKDFKFFYEDMFPSWEEGKILDRRDNDLGYSPENCRWVDTWQSAENRRPRGSCG